MGPKITIDSSTLMNKGLEVIEAHELFGMPYDPIEVVVHPQSVVHSMVEFTDGSTIAQLSMPDMRLPIGYALGYPARIGTPFGRIDWSELGRLDFEPPDLATFRCLPLPTKPAGSAAPRRHGSAPRTRWRSRRSSAARSRWPQIAEVCDATLQRHSRDADDRRRHRGRRRAAREWRATSSPELVRGGAA